MGIAPGICIAQASAEERSTFLQVSNGQNSSLSCGLISCSSAERNFFDI